jgi:hypothetical protein
MCSKPLLLDHVFEGSCIWFFVCIVCIGGCGTLGTTFCIRARTKLIRGHQLMSHITLRVFPEPNGHGKHPLLVWFRPKMIPKLQRDRLRKFSFLFKFIFKGLKIDVQGFWIRQLKMVQILDAKFGPMGPKQIWKQMTTYRGDLAGNLN